MRGLATSLEDDDFKSRLRRAGRLPESSKQSALKSLLPTKWAVEVQHVNVTGLDNLINYYFGK